MWLVHAACFIFYNGHPKAKVAFKVCPTPDPCLVVEGQRHKRCPGVPRTKSSILLTIRIRQFRWRAPTTLDAFNAIQGESGWLVALLFVELAAGAKIEGRRRRISSFSLFLHLLIIIIIIIIIFFVIIFFVIIIFVIILILFLFLFLFLFLSLSLAAKGNFMVV
jgi:hypothetical protein